ncbi:MAG: PilZ domain-containing protein [Desulfobulbaceae bacterium]|nr:PilZ domain-containing protein [Desulfobulbaceae bacterium]HIJ90380.1 PilZ domain-containing protein [Deltaproteobacteria bacterium]
MPKEVSPDIKIKAAGIIGNYDQGLAGVLAWGYKGKMMAGGFHEQRKEARVYFSPGENICGVFVFPDFGRFSFSAPVLDLSLGGLQFTLKREEWNSLEIGRQLVLARLSKGDEVVCNKAIPLTVRWVLDHPMVSNISVGCEFDGLSEDGRKMLRSFLASKLAISGQSGKGDRAC